MKKIKHNWIAFKNLQEKECEFWCVCSKAFFSHHGFLPSNNCTFEIDGMVEVQEHQFEAKDGCDAKKCLKKAGFEIVEDPIWCWDKRFKMEK